MKTSYLMLLFFVLIVQTFSLKSIRTQKKQDEDLNEDDMVILEILCRKNQEDCEIVRDVISKELIINPSDDFSEIECQYVGEIDAYCAFPPE